MFIPTKLHCQLNPMQEWCSMPAKIQIIAQNPAPVEVAALGRLHFFSRIE